MKLKTSFVCQQCGAIGHADVLTARNLTRKAAGTFPATREREKAGIQTRDRLLIVPCGGVS